MGKYDEWVAFEHTPRFGMTTTAVLRFLLDTSTDNASKITARVTKAGLLARHKLPDGQTHYFTPSAKVCRELGLNERMAEPLGPKGLIRAFSVLNYCVTNNVEKLTAAEFKERYPELLAPQMPSVSNYCHDPADEDEDGTPRLSYLYIHYGSTVENLLHKVARGQERRKAVRAFADLIDAGYFINTLLVATEAVEEDIARTVRHHGQKIFPRGMPLIRVEVVPEMLTLIGGPSP